MRRLIRQLRGRDVMRFHILRFTFTGSAENFDKNAEPNLDIADEFSRISRTLGFEGMIDTYAGLWSTQYTYDDHSLLTGDFLHRGVNLDLLCDVLAPIPFPAIFSSLHQLFRHTARCTITEATLSCRPYSVSSREHRRETHGDLRRSVDALSAQPTHAIVSLFSSMRYTVTYAHNASVATYEGEEELPLRQYDLHEVAVLFSALWSQHIEPNFQDIQHAQISFS